MPQAFLFQRGCGSLGAFTDETYFHADRLPRSMGEKCHAVVMGNRLPFPPKSKNNLSGIHISQPSMSLSVRSFSYEIANVNVN